MGHTHTEARDYPASPPRSRVQPGYTRLLATSASNREVAIWNVGSRARIATLDIGQNGNALRFSPDSKVLAAISDDGVTLQRFDTSWATRHLCQIVHRDMTAEEWNTFVPGRAYQRSCT